MSKWPETEVQLAAELVADLQDRGWTVYQEVEIAGPVCDVVAVQGAIVWAIECKVTLGLAVLAQAKGWIGMANLVSAAVPHGRSTGRSFAEETAAAFGIGVLSIRAPDPWAPGIRRVSETVRPAFLRRSSGRIKRALRPEHQTSAPAGSNGGRFTPYRATIKRLQELLRTHGPLPVRKAVALLGGQHHYASEASARGSLSKYARAGQLDGICWVEQGRPRPGLLALEETPR